MKPGSSVLLSITVFAALGAAAGGTAAQDLQMAVHVGQTDARGAGLLDVPARLSVERSSLAAALTELRRRAGVPIVFSESFLPAKLRVSCACEGLTVRAALDRLLAGTDLRYAAMRTQILIEPGPERFTMPRARLASIYADGAHARSGGGRVTLLHAPAVLFDGRVTGRVTDAQSGAALGNVQVSVAGSRLGALTNSAGQYQLAAVPAGQIQLVAQFIGYARGEAQVTVVTDSTAVANFTMRRVPLALDEVVVTGTAGAARRREVGNSIVQIDAASIAEPVATVDQLLAHAPGVNVQPGSGGIGGGAQIRLRGNVSVSMSNQPLVYIDGVRVRSDGYRANEARITSSPLNDINPNDIARIEVIKGAAATTLYGAEAAVGVIQIFTKQGTSATPAWTLQIDQGFDRARKFAGEQAPYLHLDPWLRTGHRQRYDLSVSGGNEDVRYFLSGGLEDATGVLPNDELGRYSVRGNLSFNPRSDLQLQFNSALTRSDIANTTGGNAARGFILNVFRGDQNYIGSAAKEDIDEFLDYEALNAIDRTIMGLTASYNPRPWLTSRLTFGYDRADQEARGIRPFGFVADPPGYINVEGLMHNALSADFATTADWRLSPDVLTSFSVGGQLTSIESNTMRAEGERLGGPGEPTVSSAAIRVAEEDLLQTVNGGVFVQNLLGWRDRIFLTTGLRADGNSAFGSNLGVQLYPKASVSYVISEEGFWPAQLGTTKLRAAYGHAGRAPGAFDAVRTWEAVGWGDVPAFWPENVGNADLAPERTAELELGFDASLLDDRLRTTFTYYDAHTTDALFAVEQIPSLGFLGSQLRNVGELQNRGVELRVDAGLLRTQAVDWDMGLSVTTNKSEVLSLGGAPAFSIGFEGWIVEGQPVPVIRGDRILNPDALADPEFESNAFFGPNLPTHTFGLDATLRLPYDVRLYARGEYQGGHYMNLRAISSSMSREVGGWPICIDAHALRAAERGDEVTARKRMECFASFVENDRYNYPADFFRFRELTLSAPVGVAIPGATEARLTFSARNFWSWINSDWPMFDPEMSGDDGLNSPVRHVRENIPPPITYTASLRLAF